MKDNSNLLKKWLFSYLAISILVFAFVYYLGVHYLGATDTEALILFLLESIVALFFYLKITKKSIWWCLTTIFLAYFFSFSLSLLIFSISNSSSSFFFNSLLVYFFTFTFNLLFMFAGVYIKEKKAANNWDNDILDDLDS